MRGAGRYAAHLLLRVVLLLAATEGTLALVAWGLARFGGDRIVPGARGAIFCVGDSCTEGLGAPMGRSYPDQLRALFERAGDPRTVANLGTSGFTTDRMLDRLEVAVERARPAYVVFSGGVNDGVWRNSLSGLLRAPQPPPGSRSRALLRRLRTIRVLEAGARMALGLGSGTRGDSARASPYPDPLQVPWEEEARAFEEAARGGAEPLFRWVAHYWSLEEPLLAERAFERFRRLPEFDSLRKDLLLPLEYYLWELAMLRGQVPREPLQAGSADEPAKAFAAFARGYVALAEGRTDEARSTFDAVLSLHGWNPWVMVYVRVHRAWASILERDFAGADAELRAVLPALVGISPRVALWHGLGASALAHVLRDDRTRLASWFEEHGRIWNEVVDRRHSPLGREWMMVAEWVDAIKGGDVRAIAEAEARERRRFGGAPSTAPLGWLMRNPGADFATVRRDLPLEAPRIAYLGALSWFWRWLKDDEVEGLLRHSIARVDALAKEVRFQPILMTYLDYQAERINQLLQRLAVEKGWPIVDPASLYGVERLGEADKRRYFHLDRTHPNEAGYALLAQAVFERIRNLEAGF